TGHLIPCLHQFKGPVSVTATQIAHFCPFNDKFLKKVNDFFSAAVFPHISASFMPFSGLFIPKSLRLHRPVKNFHHPHSFLSFCQILIRRKNRKSLFI